MRLKLILELELILELILQLQLKITIRIEEYVYLTPLEGDVSLLTHGMDTRLWYLMCSYSCVNIHVFIS